MECYLVDPTYTPFLKVFSVYRYDLPSGRPLYTREAREGVSSSGLASHRLFGVDNTGNVRVWAAELLLLRWLLSHSKLLEGR